MTRTYTRCTARRSHGTTERQLELVEAIRQARLDHPTYGPSIRELADALGVGTNDVMGKLCCLRRDGVVAWADGVARSIHVVGD